jgi:hypothetical protein
MRKKYREDTNHDIVWREKRLIDCGTVTDRSLHMFKFFYFNSNLIKGNIKNHEKFF